MRRVAPIAILLGLLAFAGAGCSDSKPGEKIVSPLPTKITGTVPKATPVSTAVPAQYKHGDAAAGKSVFTSAGCVSCHTLQDANAHGTIGPNLTRFGNRHSIGAGADLLDGMTDDQKVAELTRWLHNPDDIKLGTTKNTNPSRAMDGMNIPRTLTDEEIDTLAHYLVAQK